MAGPAFATLLAQTLLPDDMNLSTATWSLARVARQKSFRVNLSQVYEHEMLLLVP